MQPGQNSRNLAARHQERTKAIYQNPADVMAEMALRDAARERLIPFCQYLWPDFQTRPYRELIAAALELLEARLITRLMIFAPPQWGKSEIISRNYPAWYIGRNPDHNVIMASYSSDLAENLSYDARSKILEPRYRSVFGDLSPYELPVSLSAQSSSTREWRIKNYRGRVKAAGIGGGITGYGAHLISVDDPVKDATEADSPTTQERNIRWWRSSAITRLSPDGLVLIAMTRWNENDLAGFLLRDQENGGDLYYVLRLTAMAESPKTIMEWCKRNNVTKERYIVSDMLDPFVARKQERRRLREAGLVPVI